MLESLKRKAVLWNRRRLHRRGLARLPGYTDWCAQYDCIDASHAAELQARLQALPAAPEIALVLHGAASDADAQALLASLREQVYPHWRLHVGAALAADQGPGAIDWAAVAHAEQRVQLTRSAPDSPDSFDSRDSRDAWPAAALAAGTEPWACVIEPGDRLRPHALLLLVEAALRDPGVLMVFGDEDRSDASGQRHAHHFKCQLHRELLLSHDCIGRPFMVSRHHLAAVAGASTGAHDLALRCTEGQPDTALAHVPHVLLHRTGPPAARSASADAVQQHLARTGQQGKAQAVDGLDAVRVRFALPGLIPGLVRGLVPGLVPDSVPTVSVIIPTRNGTRLLDRCLRSLLLHSTYPAFDVTVVDNGSDDPRCLALMDRWQQRDPRVRVRRDERPFNFAALNNAAIADSNSDFVALVNDDIEFITPGWLEEMVSLAARDGVGAVGARLLYGDGTVQHGGVIVGIGGGAGHAQKRLHRDDPGYAGRALRLQNFSAVTAACLVVRRAHWLAVGGMDARHFAVAFNDVDFCLRLRAAGLRNVWTPHAEMFHHESVSRGRDLHGERLERYQREFAALRALHPDALRDDPAYNPNLTLRQENFALACPPRAGLLQSRAEAAVTAPSPTSAAPAPPARR